MLNNAYVFSEEAFFSYNLLLLGFHFECVVNAFFWFLYIHSDVSATSFRHVTLHIVESYDFITTAQNNHYLL